MRNLAILNNRHIFLCKFPTHSEKYAFCKNRCRHLWFLGHVLDSVVAPFGCVWGHLKHHAVQFGDTVNNTLSTVCISLAYYSLSYPHSPQPFMQHVLRKYRWLDKGVPTVPRWVYSYHHHLLLGGQLMLFTSPQCECGREVQ